jgi:hypothetical protein
MTASEEIQKHYDAATKIAYNEVKRLAYKTLTRYKSLTGFCMGMGVASLWDKNGPLFDDDKRFKEIDNFLQEWGYTLFILGWPLKIDRNPDGSYTEKTNW